MQRGAEYQPVHVDQAMALAAVRDRLWLGVLAAGFAAFCLFLIVAAPQTQFGVAALASFGFTSLTFAVASLLSARREEFVHRLAGNLEQRALLEDQGEDGTP